MCCRSFIVEKIYDLLRNACGLLDFLFLEMFLNRPDVKPKLAPHVGPFFILPRVGLDVFICIGVTLYKFNKCTKSVFGCTTYQFIAIPAV